jgi:exonuclease VII small subunit
VDELDQLYEIQLKNLKEYINSVEKETNKLGETLKLQNVSLILIFIAHATISDATKEIQKQLENGQVDNESPTDQDIL